MEFLGVGYQEILVILVLLLVVVGPDRLPQMAYQIGRAVREMQKYARAVRDEFSDEMKYIEEQYNTVRGDIDQARQELQQEQQTLNSEFRSFDRDLRDAAQDVDRDLEAAVPDEVKTDGRNNVVPISSASAQKTGTGDDGETKRPIRPGERPSRPTPKRRPSSTRSQQGRGSTGGSKSSSTTPRERSQPTKQADSTSKNEETGGDDNQPPLVF